MNKENQLLVTSEPTKLRNDQLKFKKITYYIREYMEYVSQIDKEKPKDHNMQLLGWAWKTLGSWSTMPKILHRCCYALIQYEVKKTLPLPGNIGLEHTSPIDMAGY